MDADRFDDLARTVQARSRRGFLGSLSGLSLGGALALLLRLDEVAAKNGKHAHGEGKKGKGKKGKGKKKKRKTTIPPPNPGTPAPPPPPAPPRPRTCFDGSKNGSESDVDCGGSCFRCGVGKTCASRDDCTTARCLDGRCQFCTTGDHCPNDEGTCGCVAGRCSKLPGTSVPSCEYCPAGRLCVTFSTGTECYKPCGSAETCPAGRDACKGQLASCGSSGRCFQPLEGGPTRCGAVTATASCGCTSSEQCAANHGAGAFCVQITGPECTCAPGISTFCATPR